MVLGVLAEILQLFKSTATQHLTEKQKQPIDGFLLLRDDGFHAMFLLAELAGGKIGVHPDSGSTVVHGGFVVGDKGPDFKKLLAEIELQFVASLAALALDIADYGEDLVGNEVVEAVDGGSPVGGPGEWGRDQVALALAGACVGLRRARRGQEGPAGEGGMKSGWEGGVGGELGRRVGEEGMEWW
ncbi:hypothetical protein LOK49_LG05G01947 [Camellia lanceoleosa]|uniref:Uncharacterized protein n=1 Tax=Camellia lanceoleosa TaxID=1840588 RepID=A0ACC0HTG8_9ERIC|nr:hypothetical protein LOK49_LG05G01947 [Camellia lanceoleosa]